MALRGLVPGRAGLRAPLQPPAEGDAGLDRAVSGVVRLPGRVRQHRAAGSPAAPGWLVAAAALLAGAAHLLNAVPDLADDAATGVHGLPHRLGARGSLLAASGLLLAATLTLLAAARPPLWAGLAALATTAGLIVTGWYAAPRTAFRALLAAAAVDLVLLVLSGAL
ncbi:hypothetical protein ACFQY4_01625 [Catellatospora bangladeshensis]|uniref:hypothetical protein n=1 Tax=Catellatospora bangladeshensis TaxID=310355 RepID=UPI003610B2EE